VNTHLQLLLRQRLTKLLPHSLESHGSGGCLLREERHFLALQRLHFGLLVLDKLLVAQPRKPGRLGLSSEPSESRVVVGAAPAAGSIGGAVGAVLGSFLRVVRTRPGVHR
jgi:hypothetical protein